MSEQKKTAPIGRRDFFKKAGMGAGALGAAAAAGAGVTAAEAADPAAQGSGGSGYRETDLVKKYYELARF